MPLRRIGYPCVSLLINRTTNHETILRTGAPEKLRGLIAQNLADLRAILEHNLAHDWRLFRIGSSVIPFGSHPVNTIKWWQEFKDELRSAGKFARANDMRLSLHPGQYTVLNSPDAAIVSRAIAELTYSARFLDELGMDSSNKIVIHLGGTYGDKPAAMRRFCETVNTLPDDLRHRIVIENDERSYSPADALAVSKQTNLPVVFDNLHYTANPGEGQLEDLLKQIFATWKKRDGHPKVHFSSQAQGRKLGSHADQAEPAEFKKWVKRWGAFDEFDLMLEAKHKDKALLQIIPSTKKENL
ncbi:MAG: UV DNA damage repair endonuclease UvsE [Chloroflexi bacterium]|nr:UV DNA damage repair endonuclease UvsE [Chloroflexota bacterium]